MYTIEKSMFYAYAIGSMIGYSLQSVLMVHYCRKMDGLSTATYRGLSFIITLTPLLLGRTITDIAELHIYWKWLLIAGTAGGISLGLMYSALNYLPMGVAGSLNKGFGTLTILFLAVTVLGEVIDRRTLILIVIILLGTVALGMQKNHHEHLENSRIRGAILSALASIPFAITITIFSFLSRSHNPWVVGYFWEVSVGIGALALVIIRWLLTGQGVARISMKDFCLLALCGSPTLIGTGLFGLATKIGPMSIVSSIGTASLVVTSLIAWLFYREPLRMKQWLSIGIVLAGVVGLKFI